MAEQSHREEMNAAIRAQRERQAAAARQDAPAPQRPSTKLFLGRIVGRLRGK
jgi:hypothetical protein